MDRALKIVTTLLNGTYKPEEGDYNIFFSTTRDIPTTSVEDLLDGKPELKQLAEEVVKEEFQGAPLLTPRIFGLKRDHKYVEGSPYNGGFHDWSAAEFF